MGNVPSLNQPLQEARVGEDSHLKDRLLVWHQGMAL